MGFGQSPTRIVSLVLLLIISNYSYTEIAFSHSLYWGFKIGDQFAYHCNFTGFAMTKYQGDLYYSVMVGELPNITDNLNSITNLERKISNCVSLYFMNGSEFSYWWYNELFWSAYPLGNWSLIEGSLLAEIDPSSTEVQFNESTSEWGFYYFKDDPDWNTTQTFMYSKEDGVANRYNVEYLFHDGGSLSFGNIRLIHIEDEREKLVRIVSTGLGVISIGLTIAVLVLFWKGIEGKRKPTIISSFQIE